MFAVVMIVSDLAGITSGAKLLIPWCRVASASDASRMTFSDLIHCRSNDSVPMLLHLLQRVVMVGVRALWSSVADQDG